MRGDVRCVKLFNELVEQENKINQRIIGLKNDLIILDKQQKLNEENIKNRINSTQFRNNNQVEPVNVFQYKSDHANIYVPTIRKQTVDTEYAENLGKQANYRKYS